MYTVCGISQLLIAWTLAVWLGGVCCQDAGGCFQVPSESCSFVDPCKCRTRQSDNTAHCCNITSSDELRENINCGGIQSATALHIRNSSLHRFDANTLIQLNRLVSLSITENMITHIRGQFRGQELSLSCLNISNNAITEIDPAALSSLQKIQMLDISHNNISFMPELWKQLSILRLDISGNFQLQCKSLIDMTKQFVQQSKLQEKITYLNRNNTVCLPQRPDWMNSSQKFFVPLDAIEKIREIEQYCPDVNGLKCSCVLQSLDVLKDHQFAYQARVDCSNKQMTALPTVLPVNTKYLNISNNNITSLEGIGNDRYASIQELYVDNNKISSLKPLEGSKFLYNFNVLSLRENSIEVLQTYIFSSVFDRNLGKKIFLADNKLMCDCNTAQQVKIWLAGNKAHIPDNEDVWCSNLPNTRVIELDHRSVCVTPTDWTDYIHYVIALEIMLFIFLICKVSYDYYVFKTAGYLPWPASKMPKLPCDCCFET